MFESFLWFGVCLVAEAGKRLFDKRMSGVAHLLGKMGIRFVAGSRCFACGLCWQPIQIREAHPVTLKPLPKTLNALLSAHGHEPAGNSFEKVASVDPRAD